MAGPTMKELETSTEPNRQVRLIVSLKSLAAMLDAHRSSVRRWLTDAGIHPIVVGRGRNAAVRYRWHEIERWLETREEVD